MNIRIQRFAHLCAAKVLINKVITKYFAVFFNKNREKQDSQREYINGNVNGDGNFLLKNTDSKGL